MTLDVRRVPNFVAGVKYKGNEMGPKVNRGRVQIAGGNTLVVPGAYGLGRNNTAWGPNIARFEPMIIGHPSTLDGMYVEVTSVGGAGTGLKMALYRADENWVPTALVLSVAAVAIDTTGIKSVTGLATDLTPGRYLRAWKHNSGTVTLRTTNASIPQQFIGPTISAAPFSSDLRCNHTYATAWPDPGPAPTNTTAATVGWFQVVFLDLSVV
jgi:hypothetical protein